jgi:Kef-type K+ transport system membrane component KefB
MRARGVRRSIWGFSAYGGLVLGGIALFLAIRAYGESLVAPASGLHGLRGQLAGGAPDILWHLLIVLTVVVVVGRVLGRLFGFIRQPPVIGEVIAGIVLGPSLLGQISPDAYQYLLPSSVAPFLGVIAQLGVILYMFLVGLELDPDSLRGQVRATVATAHASIVVPFILGAALSVYLYPRFSTSDVPFTSFALFLGVAMSITAFPVLARILSEQRMTHTKVGMIALSCAAINDATAWCLLAFIVGVVQAQAVSALMVAVLTMSFIGLMFVAVRPLAAKMTGSWDKNPSQSGIALTLVCVLVAALTTDGIGVHAIFGAFLLGAVIPHDSTLARSLRDNLENFVTILLLPAFFAFTGMRTQIGLLSTWYEWVICGLIIVVAVAGKFGGTVAAARVTGMNWRDATGLGVLMNTRGLMELIVLNIGLDLGVISPTLFTMIVLMAVATTIMTAPLLRYLVLQETPDHGDERFRRPLPALVHSKVGFNVETPTA